MSSEPSPAMSSCCKCNCAVAETARTTEQQSKIEKHKLEQRCAIKFCVKLNESATETYEKLRKAYGTDALSRAQIFKWHRDFLGGREKVDNKPRSARRKKQPKPVESNNTAASAASAGASTAAATTSAGATAAVQTLAPVAVAAVAQEECTAVTNNTSAMSAAMSAAMNV